MNQMAHQQQQKLQSKMESQEQELTQTTNMLQRATKTMNKMLAQIEQQSEENKVITAKCCKQQEQLVTMEQNEKVSIKKLEARDATIAYLKQKLDAAVFLINDLQQQKKDLMQVNEDLLHSNKELKQANETQQSALKKMFATISDLLKRNESINQ